MGIQLMLGQKMLVYFDDQDFGITPEGLSILNVEDKLLIGTWYELIGASWMYREELSLTTEQG